jgi:hypothetical protein
VLVERLRSPDDGGGLRLPSAYLVPLADVTSPERGGPVGAPEDQRRASQVIGSTTVPSSRTSKCRCGPVE